jgi:hypothetical protein
MKRSIQHLITNDTIYNEVLTSFDSLGHAYHDLTTYPGNVMIPGGRKRRNQANPLHDMVTPDIIDFNESDFTGFLVDSSFYNDIIVMECEVSRLTMNISVISAEDLTSNNDI